MSWNSETAMGGAQGGGCVAWEGWDIASVTAAFSRYWNWRFIILIGFYPREEVKKKKRKKYFYRILVKICNFFLPSSFFLSLSSLTI